MASSTMQRMPTPDAEALEAMQSIRQADTPAVAEAAARADLRRQIARLDAQLGELEADGIVRMPTGARSGRPRTATLGELERTRDALAVALGRTRKDAEERSERREVARSAVESAIADPAAHKWLRVRSDELGEPSCKHWHVKPRLGLIGMLAGWWRVKVSSGCPLACRA